MSDSTPPEGGLHDLEPADRERIEVIQAPLLACLEALEQVARHIHPGTLAAAARGGGDDLDKLRMASEDLSEWPAHLEPLARQFGQAAGNVLTAFERLAETGGSEQAMFMAYRALRGLPKAHEALYPLAGLLPGVSRHFLEPDQREDDELVEALSGVAPEGTGVLAFGPDLDSRQTFWAYVPETYDAARRHPLVVALHGGSGKGRTFLWSWLRAARSRGAILIAPTSLGQTWALQGEDIDSPHLARIVAFARDRWNIDPARILMTGMSDGGTFSYVSGLQKTSPFTHLAPFSAAFHPMLGSFADADRLNGLPVHIVHGTLDWMFPPELAHMARDWFQQAGAALAFHEVADLSHTYAPEFNTTVLDWMDRTA